MVGGLLVKVLAGVVGVPVVACGTYYLIKKNEGWDESHEKTLEDAEKVRKKILNGNEDLNSGDCREINEGNSESRTTSSLGPNGSRSTSITRESSHTRECTKHSTTTTE